MIYSMTGFGRATAQIGEQAYTVEIKSLNSKQFDLNLRVPTYLREKEMAIRTLLSNEIKRGKVEVYISASKGTEPVSTKFNKALIAQYMEDLSDLQSKYHLDGSDVLNALLGLPNVMVTEEKELTDEEWHLFEAALKQAITKLITFRTQEGAALGDDLEARIKEIEAGTIEVEEIAPGRIDKVRDRINANLEQLTLKSDYNKDRFEQEMIYYLEKFDVTEEIVRLKNHCNYFLETLHSNVIMKGKKLNFISQELGREINTVGSKANDLEVQKLVVAMKDSLEKVKEQMNNIL